MNNSNPQSGIWAVIPVKQFDRAKQRLSPVLDAGERCRLSRVMLEDVLDAVSKASLLDGVLVVTCERGAKELADTFAAGVLIEAASCGLCEAVKTAGCHLVAEGCSGMMVIPGDVPLISAEEIDRVVSNHGMTPAVTLVPAWDGDGTNALLFTPVDVISLHFGENSFFAHKNAALEAGLEPRVLTSLGLALDLDAPGDLATFLARHSTTRTAKYLEEIHVSERFETSPQTPELK